MWICSAIITRGEAYETNLFEKMASECWYLRRKIMHSVKGKRGHMTANSQPRGCFIFFGLFISSLVQRTRKHFPKIRLGNYEPYN